MHKKGFVYLVGAGCGSADLITVRGLRLLQSCDAVVYDDLIDPALLAQAAHAEQHPAGKRCGRQSQPHPKPAGSCSACAPSATTAGSKKST